MWNEILSDLWRVYRGRLLGSVFGLFIGAMFLILGFLQTIFFPSTPLSRTEEVPEDKRDFTQLIHLSLKPLCFMI